jgi:O-antigen/teichoic acid export membrane protein
MSLLEGHPVSAEKQASPSLDRRNLRSQVVSGSLILLAGSGLVGVTNLVYNVAVARMLGPIGFAQATAVYTLLMLMSAVTLSFQIVCAKLVANHESPEEKAAVYAGLHRKAWAMGVGIGLLMLLGRGLISSYLNLPDQLLIVLLSAGTAFYIPLGARRGCMQGVYAFSSLAGNLLIEGLVRLGGAFLLIKAGIGVRGAVLASVTAVMLAYLSGRPQRELRVTNGLQVATSFREGLQAIVFFAGQVVINNFDIVLVKHFFASEKAGVYAAVALVGRFVNMCAWSVVSTMFPVSAARQEDRGGRSLLYLSLGMVLSIVGVVILGLWMVPNFIWKVIFGPHFTLAGYGPIDSLLILYAVTTAVYSLSAVVIAYEMSRKIVNTGWLQLAFSGAMVLGIYRFHGSLQQVIVVQLTLMILLLITVLVPAIRARVEDVEPTPPILRPHLRIRRPLSEPEVIAEFLRSEFHHPEFDSYRERLEHLVKAPDLTDDRENHLRRSLLFLRRGAMWRELPADTRWFEVELTSHGLSRIRVFPRAQWRKIAQGNFYLPEISRRVREELAEGSEGEFYSKLRQLGQSIQQDTTNTTVLLIGVDENRPLTILDGNHRIAASMLAAPSTIPERFRFICGFSSGMTGCCWYRTNLTTLSRYAKNLVRYFSCDPKSEIQSYLHSIS